MPARVVGVNANSRRFACRVLRIASLTERVSLLCNDARAIGASEGRQAIVAFRVVVTLARLADVPGAVMDLARDQHAERSPI